ncbi:MAG TPA: FUSC family protein [Acetobacteraceae bacterium]|nr:FUSC family protein [Acetobacteraceae bacterium]
MRWNDRLLFAVFALRCAGAATLAYWLATVVGLPHPLWATVSAVIVSQDRFMETRLSISGRIVGTIIGAGVAVAIGLLALRLHLDITVQIAAAVAICAVVARRWPALRVCMWTGPIVLLTASQSGSIVMAGFHRGSEVILGVLVGGLLHLLVERILYGEPAPSGWPPGRARRVA